MRNGSSWNSSHQSKWHYGNEWETEENGTQRAVIGIGASRTGVCLWDGGNWG